MRILSDYEVNLVAGGVSSSSEEDIIVTGWRMYWENWSWFEFGVGGGGGGAGGSTEAEPVAEPKETPCVETTLASGVSTTDANRAALAASNKIAELNDETYEYSSIIWTLNGEVGYTAPHKGQTDEVNWVGGIGNVPDGAVIIGIVHNHPDDPVINDRIPSGAGSENGRDWTAYDQLVNWNRDHDAADDLPRGITVDANMLLYIYTNENNKTHVYDKTDKNQTSASCTLQ